MHGLGLQYPKGIVKIMMSKFLKENHRRSRNAIKKGNVEEIDGNNLHLTNGIIDEHTHIGLSRGVNEAEAILLQRWRMSDVINPDDVNFYRQIVGGVTTAQQLHGSANPIMDSLPL